MIKHKLGSGFWQSKKHQRLLMRFWWSWWALPPRPIGNKFGDYRFIPLEIS